MRRGGRKAGVEKKKDFLSACVPGGVWCLIMIEQGVLSGALLTNMSQIDMGNPPSPVKHSVSCASANTYTHTHTCSAHIHGPHTSACMHVVIDHTQTRADTSYKQTNTHTVHASCSYSHFHTETDARSSAKTKG